MGSAEFIAFSTIQSPYEPGRAGEDDRSTRGLWVAAWVGSLMNHGSLVRDAAGVTDNNSQTLGLSSGHATGPQAYVRSTGRRTHQPIHNADGAWSSTSRRCGTGVCHGVIPTGRYPPKPFLFLWCGLSTAKQNTNPQETCRTDGGRERRRRQRDVRGSISCAGMSSSTVLLTRFACSRNSTRTVLT